MQATLLKNNNPAWMPGGSLARTCRVEVRELVESDRQAAVALLSEDPLRGVHLRGLVEDYGIRHPGHRGRFFGYFENGKLRNIALLGHHILIYSEAGLAALAAKAQEVGASGHLLLGPTRQVEAFWAWLSQYGRETRIMSQQHWFVCRRALMWLDNLQLQRATVDRLDEIVEIQAGLVMEQSGIDPRDKDAAGFRRRVLERLERGRTFVKIADGKVVFKAELISETERVVYLESIWTHPEYRGRGIATACVNELTRRFLSRGKVVAILVELEEPARRIYERVGFVQEGNYLARFLK